MVLSKSLHIFFNRYIPSIVYAKMQLFRCLTFMIQKNRPTYQRALQFLIEKQYELRPGSIMCDFEKVFHQALEDVFGER